MKKILIVLILSLSFLSTYADILVPPPCKDGHDRNDWYFICEPSIEMVEKEREKELSNQLILSGAESGTKTISTNTNQENININDNEEDSNPIILPKKTEVNTNEVKRIPKKIGVSSNIQNEIDSTQENNISDNNNIKENNEVKNDIDNKNSINKVKNESENNNKIDNSNKIQGIYYIVFGVFIFLCIIFSVIFLLKKIKNNN